MFALVLLRGWWWPRCEAGRRCLFSCCGLWFGCWKAPHKVLVLVLVLVLGLVLLCTTPTGLCSSQATCFHRTWCSSSAASAKLRRAARLVSESCFAPLVLCLSRTVCHPPHPFRCTRQRFIPRHPSRSYLMWFLCVLCLPANVVPCDCGVAGLRVSNNAFLPSTVNKMCGW